MKIVKEDDEKLKAKALAKKKEDEENEAAERAEAE